MNQATQGAEFPSGQVGSRRATSANRCHEQATQGDAASPQDVQSQTRGRPTAAQQAEGVRRSASEKLVSAQDALEQARGFDRNGQEALCIDAIERAKRFAG
jgi:hypothetical protein